jgi:hypothetical protein
MTISPKSKKIAKTVAVVTSRCSAKSSYMVVWLVVKAITLAPVKVAGKNHRYTDIRKIAVDLIQAYGATHCSQMYYKSCLIFERLALGPKSYNYSFRI